MCFPDTLVQDVLVSLQAVYAYITELAVVNEDSHHIQRVRLDNLNLHQFMTTDMSSSPGPHGAAGRSGRRERGERDHAALAVILENDCEGMYSA